MVIPSRSTSRRTTTRSLRPTTQRDLVTSTAAPTTPEVQKEPTALILGPTAPGLMLLRVGATLQGEPREQGIDTCNLHLATPETAGRTHYWYWSTRNFAIDAQANAAIRPIVEFAFTQQDKPMLEAQQRRIGAAEFWSLKPVLLASDAGAVRARRKLDALIAAEAVA